MINTNAYINTEGITQENVNFYAEYGLLVAPSLLSADEVNTLKKETAAISIVLIGFGTSGMG